MTLAAYVDASLVGDRLAIELTVDRTAFEDSEDYVWNVRATVLQHSRRLVFVNGDDSKQCHEPLDENPPRLPLPWLRPPFEVAFELCVREDGATSCFGARLPIAAAGSWKLDLSSQPAPTGAPFEPRPVRRLPPYVLDSARREVDVPGLGHVRYDGSFYDPRGNRLVLERGDGSVAELVVPGDSSATFESLHASPTGWLVLQRRSGDARSFTAFRPERLPATIDVAASITHAAFDLDGELFWFTVGTQLHILELATGTVHVAARDELVRQFVHSRSGAIHVAGNLVCGFVDDTLEIYDWRRGLVVERHAVPTFGVRPLLHPSARRVLWLLRCGQREGHLSVLRWQDLDGDGVGDVLIEDGVQYAVPLPDGRCCATGERTWIITPEASQVVQRTP